MHAHRGSSSTLSVLGRFAVALCLSCSLCLASFSTPSGNCGTRLENLGHSYFLEYFPLQLQSELAAIRQNQGLSAQKKIAEVVKLLGNSATSKLLSAPERQELAHAMVSKAFQDLEVPSLLARAFFLWAHRQDRERREKFDGNTVWVLDQLRRGEPSPELSLNLATFLQFNPFIAEYHLSEEQLKQLTARLLDTDWRNVSTERLVDGFLSGIERQSITLTQDDFTPHELNEIGRILVSGEVSVGALRGYILTCECAKIRRLNFRDATIAAIALLGLEN